MSDKIKDPLSLSFSPAEQDVKTALAGFYRRLAALEAHPMIPKSFIDEIHKNLEK